MKKIIFLIVVFLLYSLNAAAFDLITNPQELFLDNVLAGSTAEKSLAIRTDSVSDVQVIISPSGTIADWIEIEPNSIYVNRYNPSAVKVKVKAPDSIPLGRYEGFLVLDTISSGNQITSAMAASTNIKAVVGITDKEIIKAGIQDIKIEDIEEENPLFANITVENKGNVPIIPVISLNISNQEIQKSFSDSIYLGPFEAKTIRLHVLNSLPKGEYNIQSSMLLNDALIKGQDSEFKVVEQGALQKKQEPEVSSGLTLLSLSPLILMIWAILLIFVVWTIKNNK
jgi:hypothetical protein